AAAACSMLSGPPLAAPTRSLRVMAARLAIAAVRNSRLLSVTGFSLLLGRDFIRGGNRLDGLRDDVGALPSRVYVDWHLAARTGPSSQLKRQLTPFDRVGDEQAGPRLQQRSVDAAVARGDHSLA